MVIPPEPLIIPVPIVKSEVAEPAAATVIVRVAPKATGQEIDAPTDPDAIWLTVILPPNVRAPLPEIVEAEEPFSKTSEVGAVVAPTANVDSASVAPALTVIEPDIVGNATPSVVVPEEINKLLKFVKVVAGRVFVAASSTVPDPRVQVLVPPDPSANELQTKVPPFVISMVAVRFELFPIVTDPLTVNFELELKTNLLFDPEPPEF